ncbi:isoprenoid biosynthesis protein with amidotransferase-like domain [Candidatus Desulfarcum epimagneticum]|uniref:Isoprenoid biosynthesis protein with amidotransferase-like domain n=1 Tax=uncultured Desulfobacteraceae bacterium TaxID=218296 RepID=A0A484HK59_9BACT|nr:isoprenoid biosynthesis protein with amidotransferase-like domain [uncultured Desulfobacteraceae bacterium]
MPKIGVLLSGCGKNDGSEIHEATLTLLFLDRAGAGIEAMAPNMGQHDVINHATGEMAGEQRNVLAESARIARGDIRDIQEVRAEDLDALVLPGGFGAAKNLCDFAEKGKDAVVNPGVRGLIREMAGQGKPLGAICIAPVVLASALSDKNPRLTIGNDMATASALEAMGARHVECPVDGIVEDEKNRIVSTPAYMLGPGIKDVAKGIEKLVNRIVEMAS